MVKSKFGGINIGWYILFILISVVVGATVSFSHTHKILEEINKVSKRTY